MAHMLLLPCHHGPLGTVCLQKNSDHMCLCPGYHQHHDTAKHGYSGVVNVSTGDCNDALLSSVMRVGSVCMRMIDVHVYTVSTSYFMEWEGHQLQLAITFGVSAG